jgi:hypothetical protein
MMVGLLMNVDLDEKEQIKSITCQTKKGFVTLTCKKDCWVGKIDTNPQKKLLSKNYSYSMMWFMGACLDLETTP